MPSISGWAWDACALLNLAATGHAPEILSALAVPSYSVKEVLQNEVLYLRPLPEEEPPNTLEKVDLSGLIQSGYLQLVELDEVEIADFVMHAAAMDDGEARTVTVALHRNLGVVTDDRLPMKYLKTVGSTIPTLTTPEWVKAWGDIAHPSSEVLSEVLRRIRFKSRYQPRSNHPLYPWWNAHF
jgi:hypothetical protein